MVIRAIGICLKPDQPQLGPWVRELEKWLLDRKIDVMFAQTKSLLRKHLNPQPDPIQQLADLIRAAQQR